MKKSITKLFIGTMVLGAVVALGGCSGSNKQSEEKYVQTHKYDDVTKVDAKMHQTYGDMHSLGHIRFTEKDSGLAMRVEMSKVRANTEYQLKAYEIKKDKKGEKSVKKTDKGFDLPIIKSDAEGKINSSYMIVGLSAADLLNSKLVLSRDNDDGDPIDVGAGKLKERMMF